MSIDVSFFPMEIGTRLLSLDLTHADVFALIENDLDIEIAFADITMSVAPVEGDVGRLLNLEPHEMVIRTERLTHDISGTPIDFEYLYVRPDNNQFKIRVPRW